MENLNAYSAESQMIFVNTEQGFGTAGGNQLDSFKVNFNTQPFESGDDSVLRLSVPQFNMVKNFYNVNKTNDAVRVFAVNVGDQQSYDRIIHLNHGDFVTHQSLTNDLANHIKEALEVIFGEAPSLSVTAPITYLPAQLGTTGGIVPDEAGEKNTYLFQMKFTLPTKKFRGGSNMVFQCLQITEPDDSRSSFYDSTLLFNRDETFNDSYNLLGGKRVESWKANPVSGGAGTEEQSFVVTYSGGSGSAFSEMTVTGSYPMNVALNTCPYLYLRCDVADNQATKNLVDVEESHTHEAIHSTLLAKIPRVVGDNPIDVAYTLEGGLMDFHTQISTKFLNSLRFSVVDARGRQIPQATESVQGQKSEGNLFLDMCLKIEKVKLPFSPNVLQNTPAPPTVPAGYNPAFPLVGTNLNDPNNLF